MCSSDLARADVLVVLENFAHTVEKVGPKGMVRQVVLASIGDLLGGLKGWAVN